MCSGGTGMQGNFGNVQNPGMPPSSWGASNYQPIGTGGYQNPIQNSNGYYTNGSIGSFAGGGNVQPGFAPGGPNDPALGGSGYQTYPNRPPMGNPIGYNPPVQNPGMPPMGGSFRPPSGVTLIDGGPQGNLYNPIPPSNVFDGVSRGRLAEARRFAGLGKMGKAKQQVEKGGGTWNTAMHKAFKAGN